MEHKVSKLKSLFGPYSRPLPIAPGSTPDTAYVDVAPTTVPAEPTYEEDWEVFDP